MMLTADLAISRQRGKRIEPHSIAPTDANYLQVAGDLIAFVNQYTGARREELDQAMQDYIGTGTDYRVLRGLIKLLTDRCQFETAVAIEPTEIRRRIFFKARANHPVTAEDARQAIIGEVAAELGAAPEELLDNLYADLPASQRLISFDEPSAIELIEAYNLAQAQALLYRSVEMRLFVEPQDAASYRQLFEAIKVRRLIHSISGSAAAGYEIRLTGPVAMFHRSQRYGIQMAAFLPALLLCKGWQMRAEIESKFGGSVFYELTSSDRRLQSSYLQVPTMENPLAEKLATGWAKLKSAWTLAESHEVIDLGETAFVPDFVLSHPDSRKVYLEVLGFWTPRYLNERLQEFKRGGFTDFLLIVSEELKGSRDEALNLPANALLCKTTFNAKDVLAMLSRQ
jgi:predicted nuclease of restriction endonuclease-like RecB superfamily